MTNLIFSDANSITGTNTTSDFSSEINTYLSTCTPDSNGNCQVPFNLSATDGQIEISNINITFEYNVSTLLSTAQIWDFYVNGTAGELQNISMNATPTAQNASVLVNFSSIVVPGSACQANDTNYAVAGGLCGYSLNFSKGRKFPTFDVEGISGTGTPVRRQNGTWLLGTFNLTQNITINWSTPAGAASGASQFTNTSTGWIFSNSSLINDTQILYAINSTGALVNLTQGNESQGLTFTRVSAGSDASDAFFVRSNDTNGDGIVDYEVLQESNPAGAANFTLLGNVTILTNLSLINLANATNGSAVSIWADYIINGTGADIEGATCNSSNPTATLAYNSTSGRYEAIGTVQASVEDGVILAISCNKTGYQTLTATDSYNVIASTTVVVVETGGGGGGGMPVFILINASSNQTFTLNPIDIEILVAPNANRTKSIVVGNPNSTNKTVSAAVECQPHDPSCNWAYFPPAMGNATATLNLPPGTLLNPGQHELAFHVAVPANTTLGTYRFNIGFTSGGIKKVVAVKVVVGTGISAVESMSDIAQTLSAFFNGGITLPKPVFGFFLIPNWSLALAGIMILIVAAAVRTPARTRRR